MHPDGRLTEEEAAEAMQKFRERVFESPGAITLDFTRLVELGSKRITAAIDSRDEKLKALENLSEQ